MIYPTSGMGSPAGGRERASRPIRTAMALWNALVRVCPAALRRDHGAEMEQVIRQMLVDAWRERRLAGVVICLIDAFADLARGAAEAYLDELGLSIEALRRSIHMSRMRVSAILIFCAFIALVLAGMGFQKLTEDIMKTSIPIDHPGVRAAHDVIQGGAALALAAVLIGGLPLAWDALRQAFAARRWGILALFAVPPVSLAIWLAWTWTILNVLQPLKHNLDVRQAPALLIARSWIVVFVLAAIASVAAVSIAISRSHIAQRRFRYALVAGVVATAGMLVTFAGVVAFALQIQSIAPAALSELASPLLFGESTGFSLVEQSVVMFIATAVAATSVFRGLGARPDSNEPAAALA